MAYMFCIYVKYIPIKYRTLHQVLATVVIDQCGMFPRRGVLHSDCSRFMTASFESELELSSKMSIVVFKHGDLPSSFPSAIPFSPPNNA